MQGEEKVDSRYPQRKKLSHEVPWWVPCDSTWFITINSNPPGKPQLCPANRQIGVIDERAKSILEAGRFYHEMDEPRWFIHILLLMPDHLHAIFSFPRNVSMERTIKAWKGYVKRNLGIVWQSDFFDHRLRSDEERVRKMDYIRMNPVAAGLCDEAGEWAYVLRFDPLTGRDAGE